MTTRCERKSAETKAKDAERKRLWALCNADHVRAKRKAKYEANKADSIAKAVEWNRMNKEARKQICARYSKANPDQMRATKAKRRARKSAAPGEFTKTDVQAIGKSQKWLCAVCRTSIRFGYEADHVVPLAGGGTNDRVNLQLLCMPCNRSKGARHPVDFMQSRGFLL